MSPILVRPVREQLEHDRVIRLLQAKLKRKHDVVTNIGEDQTVPVRIGQVQIFPDLVLTSTDRGHKLMGTVEVETAESVNHLEAMAQWAHLGRARAASRADELLERGRCVVGKKRWLKGLVQRVIARFGEPFRLRAKPECRS